MRKGKIKIVFAAQDLGGFNAIYPVIKKVKKFAVVKVLLSKESAVAGKNKQFSFVDCSEQNQQYLENFFVKFKPNLVVLGTSVGLSLEKLITVIARKAGVPSVAVVDFWSNYHLRFSNPGKSDWQYLADFICVIDEKMKKQLIDLTVSQGRVTITGNPFFDNFKPFHGKESDYILFVDQPFSEIYSKKLSGADCPIFNEVDILRSVLAAIGKAGFKNRVVVKLHPRCKNKEKFNSIKTDVNLTVVESDLKKLLARAQLVVGMNSMVLFEAAVRGKKVLSYQPGINKKNDPLISNILGFSHPVYNRKSLGVAIKRLLTRRVSPISKLRNRYVDGRATGRVVKLIKQLT